MILVKLSVEAPVQLSAEFYHQSETQCWSICATQGRLLLSRWHSVLNQMYNSVPIFIKLSFEAPVQLSDDLYGPGETQC